jgi:hypothetical protein
VRPFVVPWPLFSVSWSYRQPVGLLGRGISPSQGLYLHTKQHKHRINAHRYPSIPGVGFDPTIRAFELAKTIHAWDRVAGHCDRQYTYRMSGWKVLPYTTRFMSSEGKFLKVFFLCPAYAHAPPYCCHHVRNHLDREMAGRWIGRGGPTAWHPRPPDLTPLDFFLWC